VGLISLLRISHKVQYRSTNHVLSALKLMIHSRRLRNSVAHLEQTP
jgi:hypothetical protein